ncbi:MAG: hypothetical protein RR277_02175 [Rikenellaceae bacterium]
MKKFFYLLFIPIVLMACKENNKKLITAPTLHKLTEINSGWEFRQKGGDKWYKAEVPGVVHTDLFANGLMKIPTTQQMRVSYNGLRRKSGSIKLNLISLPSKWHRRI